MDISAFSGQNKVTQTHQKYLLTCLLQMTVSVPNTDKYLDLAKSNNIQNFQVYTVYENTNMAGT